jgi:3-oxoacyl-[acyl-carrier-protein] synthase-3
VTTHPRAPLRVRIAGIGKALPPRVVDNAELEHRWGLPAGWIVERTGIEQRRFADDESTVDLATRAVHDCLRDAGVGIGAVDLLVGACAIPHQALPTTSSFVAGALGMSGTACIDVNASCFSFGVGLWHAAMAIDRGDVDRAVVFSADLGSRGIDDQDPRSACLLGDGAAAVVVERAVADDASALAGFLLRTYPSGGRDAQVRGGGTNVVPGRPGFEDRAFRFQMNGKAIFKAALQHASPFLDEFFARSPVPRDQLALVIPHQTNAHGVAAFSRWLGFDDDKVVSTFRDHGNCVAAALPMALHDAVRTGRLARGQHALLCGTAAGLTLGALVVTW